MFRRLSRGLRRHHEPAMCLLHHALGDGESPNLMTTSFLIPHRHVPGWHPIPPTLVVRSYMYNRHWSHSEDLRPSNLCRPLGLRAHANLTLDSPTQVDFLFHIDVCDRFATVATIPPRWWESRHGTACDRRLWAVAGFVTSNTERPSPSAIRTTRWPSGFSKIVAWWRSGSANDQTAASNVSRRVIARPSQSRNR